MVQKSINSTIQKTIFGNGLTLLTENIPTFRSAAIGVWVKSGSRCEQPENVGVVHFIEHMLFKGTKSRSAWQLASSIEDLGGSINAYTGKEETCFYVHILDTHVEKAVEILADMLCNSLFDTKDIGMEKQVVIEEIKAVQDTPDEYILDLFHEKVFPDNPLGYPILGEIENVKKINKKKILDFYKKNYTAGNIVISIAGNVVHDVVESIISKWFILNSSSSQQTFQQAIPQKSVKYSRYSHLNQSHICIGCEAVNYTDENRYNLIAINTYLGNGLSSRLFQVLREQQGLVYNIYSFLDFYRDTGIIGFYLGTDPSKKVRAINSLKRELTLLGEKKLSGVQIANLKEQIKGGYFLSMESTSRRMSRLAKNEIIYGREISEEEIVSNINKITAHSICEAAQIYLNSSKINTVILSPEKV